MFFLLHPERKIRMARKKKSIGLIFATGSVMSIAGNRSIFFIESEEDVKKWLSEIPELSVIADIQPLYLLGENNPFTIETIENIAQLINAHEAGLDGFVVLVRGENMIRAAVGIEFMLQGLAKPVVFTGSRYSPEAIAQQDTKKIIKTGGLGLRSNLINAAQIAIDDDFGRTAIMFGNKVIKPTKAVISSFYSMNLFKSVDEKYFGKVDFGITLDRQKADTDERNFSTRLSRDVACVESASLVVNQHNATSIRKGSKPAKTLLVRMRENEKLTAELAQYLKRIYNTIFAFNENFTVTQPEGVVPLSRMTWNTVVIKALWAQANTPNREEFIALMQREIIGESLQL